MFELDALYAHYDCYICSQSILIIITCWHTALTQNASVISLENCHKTMNLCINSNGKDGSLQWS